MQISFKPELFPEPTHISYVPNRLVLHSPFDIEYDVYIRDPDNTLDWKYYKTTIGKETTIEPQLIRIVPEGMGREHGVNYSLLIDSADNLMPFHYSALDALPDVYTAKNNPDSNISKLLNGLLGPLEDLTRDATKARLERSLMATDFFEPWCDNIVKTATPPFYGDGVKLNYISNIESASPTRFTYVETTNDLTLEMHGLWKSKYLNYTAVSENEQLCFYFNAETESVIGFLEKTGDVIFSLPVGIENIKNTFRGLYFSAGRFYILTLYSLYTAEFGRELNITKIADVNHDGYYLAMLPGGFATYNNGYELYKARYDLYTYIDKKYHVLDDYNSLTDSNGSIEFEHHLLWTAEDDKQQLLGQFRSEHQDVLDFHITSQRFLRANPGHDIESIERAMEALNVDCEIIDLMEINTLSENEKAAVLNAVNIETTFSKLKINDTLLNNTGLLLATMDEAEDGDVGIVDVLSETGLPKVLYGSNPVLISDTVQIESFSDSFKPSKYVSKNGIYLIGDFVCVPPGDENKWIRINGNQLEAPVKYSPLKVKYIKDNKETEQNLYFEGDSAPYTAQLPDFDRDFKVLEDVYVITTETLYSYYDNEVHLSSPASGYAVYDTDDSGTIGTPISDYVFGLLKANLEPAVLNSDPVYSLESSCYVDNGLWLDAKVKDGSRTVVARADVTIDAIVYKITLNIILDGNPVKLIDNPGGKFKIDISVTDIYDFAGEKISSNLNSSHTISISRQNVVTESAYLPVEVTIV